MLKDLNGVIKKELSKLICGDCLSEMKKLNDESIDLILTDPPYGCTNNDWDIRPDMAKVWKQWNRIIKSNGAVLVFADIRFAVDVILANKRNFRYQWVVEKANPTNFLNAHRMPLKSHDLVLVFYKHLPTYNPQYTYGKPYAAKRAGHNTPNYNDFFGSVTENKDGRRFPRDVIKYKNKGRHKTGTGHPTGKPQKLMEYFIKTYTNTGDVVLDSFMGGGSTGCAAIELGRDFIGIEKDKNIFELGKRNIETAKNRKKVTKCQT